MPNKQPPTHRGNWNRPEPVWEELVDHYPFGMEVNWHSVRQDCTHTVAGEVLGRIQGGSRKVDWS